MRPKDLAKLLYTLKADSSDRVRLFNLNNGQFAEFRCEKDGNNEWLIMSMDGACFYFDSMDSEDPLNLCFGCGGEKAGRLWTPNWGINEVYLSDKDITEVWRE